MIDRELMRRMNAYDHEDFKMTKEESKLWEEHIDRDIKFYEKLTESNNRLLKSHKLTRFFILIAILFSTLSLILNIILHLGNHHAR